MECDSNVSINHKRDFLLCALHVLDYLIDKNTKDSLSEAQRILDNLATCGNTLCGDE